MKCAVRPVVWALVALATLLLAAPLQATLLYSDLFEYYDDGTIIRHDFTGGTVTTLRGPGGPTINGTPTGGLILKIEEDVVVYDPVSHPFVTPGQDRYVYTISNLGYDSGNVPLTWGNTPGVGVNGVSGFNIVNAFAVPTGLMGGPSDPVTGNPWVINGFSGAGNWEWDIRPNPPDQFGGEGVGSPVGPPSDVTQNGFWFEVASGTPHGIVPMWVHSWNAYASSPGGPIDSTFQVNIWDLLVSGPTPEPGTLGLLVVGAALMGWRRRRQ